MSEPSPYAILLSCLQRNYGLGDTNIKVNSKAARNPKFIRFSMTVNEKTVEVTCKSKREGKQMASQKLLQILHPNIKSWSSLLKMYGSRAITAQRTRKKKNPRLRVYKLRTDPVIHRQMSPFWPNYVLKWPIWQNGKNHVWANLL